MQINPKELQLEALRKRREAVEIGLMSLKYNPEDNVLNNLKDISQGIQATLNDIDSEISKLEQEVQNG